MAANTPRTAVIVGRWLGIGRTPASVGFLETRGPAFDGRRYGFIVRIVHACSHYASRYDNLTRRWQASVPALGFEVEPSRVRHTGYLDFSKVERWSCRFEDAHVLVVATNVRSTR